MSTRFADSLRASTRVPTTAVRGVAVTPRRRAAPWRGDGSPRPTTPTPGRTRHQGRAGEVKQARPAEAAQYTPPAVLAALERELEAEVLRLDDLIADHQAGWVAGEVADAFFSTPVVRPRRAVEVEPDLAATSVGEELAQPRVETVQPQQGGHQPAPVPPVAAPRSDHGNPSPSPLRSVPDTSRSMSTRSSVAQEAPVSPTVVPTAAAPPAADPVPPAANPVSPAAGPQWNAWSAPLHSVRDVPAQLFPLRATGSPATAPVVEACPITTATSVPEPIARPMEVRAVPTPAPEPGRLLRPSTPRSRLEEIAQEAAAVASGLALHRERLAAATIDDPHLPESWRLLEAEEARSAARLSSIEEARAHLSPMQRLAASVRRPMLAAAPLLRTSCAPRAFASTAVVHFNLRQQALEKRRRAELDRAGIDPDADDDEPWVLPEEQERIDAEAAAKKKEDERRLEELRREQDKAAADKKKAFKAWRAGQVKKSRDIRKDRQRGMNNTREARGAVEEVTMETESKLRDTGDLDEARDYDDSTDTDVADKRKFRKQMLRDRRDAADLD